MIDCGEGTQRQLRKFKLKFSKVKHVFISHLHGDHFFGLIGLLSTFSLLNRKTELHIYGPKGLDKIINLQLTLSKSGLSFLLHFHELTSKKSEKIYEDKSITVHTIPLQHRIYANGFLFKEKTKERRLNMSKIKSFKEIEICDYQNLKNGKDFLLKNGDSISNAQLTSPGPDPISYAYCSDTAYFESIISLIMEVDLLYHESTFLDDNLALAKKTQHSTASQAAKIAKKAGIKKLILGHYSSRYTDLNLFLQEAKVTFKSTELAETGKVFTIVR